MEPPGKGRAKGEAELGGLRAHSQRLRQEERAPRGHPLPFPGACLACLPPSPEGHTLATELPLGSRNSRHLCLGQPHGLEPHFPALGPGAAELGMAVTEATLQGVTEALAKDLMSWVFPVNTVRI